MPMPLLHISASYVTWFRLAGASAFQSPATSVRCALVGKMKFCELTRIDAGISRCWKLERHAAACSMLIPHRNQFRLQNLYLNVHVEAIWNRLRGQRNSIAANLSMHPLTRSLVSFSFASARFCFTCAQHFGFSVGVLFCRNANTYCLLRSTSPTHTHTHTFFRTVETVSRVFYFYILRARCFRH